MGDVVSILLFGLGAALGVRAVESGKAGVRPLVREVVKGGIVAAETACFAASSAIRTMGELVAEARQELHQQGAGAKGGPAPGSSGPRRIEVVRE